MVNFRKFDNTKFWWAPGVKEIAYIAREMQNDTATPENNLAVFFMVLNIHLLYEAEIPLLGIFNIRETYIYVHTKKTLYMTLYGNSIHNCPKREIIQMSFKGKWINKL